MTGIDIRMINGMDVPKLRSFIGKVEEDPTAADRHPVLVARWEGGSRSRVEFGDVVTHLGGDDELNPMQTVLAALAACDVDLIASHAALLGLELEELSVEAHGHFNVASYLGIDDAPGSGYDHIEYRVRLRAAGVTEEQAAELRRRCEVSSPVGDTLTRRVHLQLDFDIG